jgi:transposase
MLAQLLLPAPEILDLQEILADATGLTLVVATTAPHVSCPTCLQPTTRRHSRYQRTLADAPWANLAVRLHLQTRRFFCINPLCPRRIFTERFPELASPSARRTARLTTILRSVGQALGGEPGARLSQELGLLTSPTTLLRLVRQTSDPREDAPRIIGIDDFAFRKGCTYGTIVVDHERGQIIDLLPDRTTESVAGWLRAHPSVSIITRDRAEAYAQGAAQGAPQATQVADRWHLLCNLSETLDEVITRLYSEMCRALAHDPTTASPSEASDTSDATEAQVLQLSAPPTSSTSPIAETVVGLTVTPVSDLGDQPHRNSTGRVSARVLQLLQLQEQRREERLARYEQVHSLRQAGQSIPQIAYALGMGERTVNRFLHAAAFPERKRRRRSASELDTYKDYLRERWAGGCRNRALLWQEIEELGYGGGYSSVYTWLCKLHGLKRDEQRGEVSNQQRRRVSRRKWRVRFVQPAGELTAEEAQEVAQVCRGNIELGKVYKLAQEFSAIVREHKRAEFDGWLQQTLDSGVEEIVRFARGLQADYAAVGAAIELPFSNGPTEGHVNRLKAVKRTMFGRAKFDLLRKRMLCAS